MSAQHTANKTITTPKLALVGIIVLVIAGLSTLDRFLANAQNVEVQHLAQRSYQDGIRFRDAGDTDKSVEAFRKAHALERRNTEYELELVAALIAADKPDEGERLIRDVLEREPNDGRANLLGAHLMLKKGNSIEAKSYYHRAIYGEWPNNAAAHRVAVRMELVDYLAKRPEHEELLAELLPLQEQAGDDPATKLHLAKLFLVAGSVSRAIDEYRAVIKQNPKNAEAHLGLGEAELRQGQYARAHDAFLVASADKPGDPEIQRQLDLSSTLASLDPTFRKLTSMEKYRRSLRILDLARSSLERCLANTQAPDSGDAHQVLASAKTTLASKPRTGITNEMSENVLGLAEKVWQARLKACGAKVAPDEEPLRLLTERLAQ